MVSDHLLPLVLLATMATVIARGPDHRRLQRNQAGLCGWLPAAPVGPASTSEHDTGQI
jgi:hypothetical protein